MAALMRLGCFMVGPSRGWSVDGVAADLRAAHDAAIRAGVVDGQVLGAAVVPERDGAVRPAEAAGELRPVAVLQKILQKRAAFRLGPALEADRVGAVDEQALAAGFRMRAHHGMDA